MQTNLYYHIKRTIVNHCKNFFGSRVKGKYVAFASDDWGDLRIDSNKELQELLSKGYVKPSPDMLYQQLASENDLVALFEILSSVTDAKGNPACFTPFISVANPDFKKIKNDNFKEYHYTTIDESIREKSGTQAWNLWLEGNERGLFTCELHCREHISVSRWMNYLRQKDSDYLDCFKLNYAHYSKKGQSKHPIVASFFVEDTNQFFEAEQTLLDAGHIFKRLFNRSPRVINPANEYFSPKYYKALNDIGIEAVVVNPIRPEPTFKGDVRKQFYYSGKPSVEGIVHILSNVVFEAPNSIVKNPLDTALCQIEAAFFWGKPAVINTHRANYVTGRGYKNRDKNLYTLKKLLLEIRKRWPDVEFINMYDLVPKLKK